MSELQRLCEQSRCQWKCITIACINIKSKFENLSSQWVQKFWEAPAAPNAHYQWNRMDTSDFAETRLCTIGLRS